MKRMFAKIIYIIRKKIQHIIYKYLEFEITHLHNGRIKIQDGFYFTDFPTFNFDQSESSIVLKENVSVRGCVNFSFFDNGKITVGRNTFFNGGCSINSLKEIVIGDHCLIGENVKMYDHNHKYKTADVLIKDQGYSLGAIVIGNNCWIGSNVTILKGVTVGDHCVIGANCLVVKDIESNSVIVSSCNNQRKEN